MSQINQVKKEFQHRKKEISRPDCLFLINRDKRVLFSFLTKIEDFGNFLTSLDILIAINNMILSVNRK